MSATAAAQQIEANRQNAALSTGPRTPEGKAASSANALGSGLFATHLYVRPAEAEGYESMRDGILFHLQPEGGLEDALAIQIVNANWRLRRCDAAEAAIPALQNEANSDIHDFAHPAQKAIDRARAAAENTIRRTTKDLKELQAERWRRASLKIAGNVRPTDLGLAPIKEAMAQVPNETQLRHLDIRNRAMNLQIKPKSAPDWQQRQKAA